MVVELVSVDGGCCACRHGAADVAHQSGGHILRFFRTTTNRSPDYLVLKQWASSGELLVNKISALHAGYETVRRAVDINEFTRSGRNSNDVV